MSNRPAVRPAPYTKPPKQTEIKRVCKGAFDGGATQVRVEVGGMVITATRETTAPGDLESPLENWERQNG